jgi:hypothetical protein
VILLAPEGRPTIKLWRAQRAEKAPASRTRAAEAGA